MATVTDWDHTNYCGVFGGAFLAAIPTGRAIIECIWVSPRLGTRLAPRFLWGWQGGNQDYGMNSF